MSFHEFRFFLFFLAVFAAYWVLPRNALRKVWLLLCSYAFYAAWDWRFLSLIVISTLVDYVVGMNLAKFQRVKTRRVLLLLSVITNLGLLGFFKYFGFFVGSARDLLALLGVPFETATLNIILPVGISFYTFQTLSYTIDIYRRRMNATRSLLDFALYVSFFPQLVAGPIVRARSFLPQLDRIKRWHWPRMQLGMQYFVLGLFKKLAIADRMSQFADPVFANPGQFETGSLWMAALAFTIQVYCDFSGYSDMAIGTANMLGYRLTKNFDMPLSAANISDFWRRWHISLSTWIRDYVFFPLGGSRGSRWKTNRNLLITLTLCGLWHGADWTFVLFGLMQGVMLAIHGHFRQLCIGLPSLSRLLQSHLGTAFRISITFASFCCTLVVFRANSLQEAMIMLQRMVFGAPGMGIPMNERGLWYATIVLIVAHVFGHHRRFLAGMLSQVPAPIRGFGYASLATLALVLSPAIDRAFIYFQF